MWLNRGRASIATALKSYQFVSDVHLNRNGWPSLKAVAKNLIIAGDINDGPSQDSAKWLKSISPSFDKIFVILGNHDHYYGNIKDNLERVHDITSSISNLRILDDSITNTYLDHDEKIILYGTTLWSYIPREYHEYYYQSAYDYKMIRDLTPKLQNKLHSISVDKLEMYFTNETNETDETNSYIPVIITHHAPLIQGCCHRQYCQNRLRSKNHMYCTDLSDLIDYLGLAHMPFWIFGHTHYHTNTVVSDVFLGSNPLGFPKTKSSPKVRKSTLYDLYIKNINELSFSFLNRN